MFSCKFFKNRTPYYAGLVFNKSIVPPRKTGLCTNPREYRRIIFWRRVVGRGVYFVNSWELRHTFSVILRHFAAIRNHRIWPKFCKNVSSKSMRNFNEIDWNFGDTEISVRSLFLNSSSLTQYVSFSLLVWVRKNWIYLSRLV